MNLTINGHSPVLTAFKYSERVVGTRILLFTEIVSAIIAKMGTQAASFDRKTLLFWVEKEHDKMSTNLKFLASVIKGENISTEVCLRSVEAARWNARRFFSDPWNIRSKEQMFFRSVEFISIEEGASCSMPLQYYLPHQLAHFRVLIPEIQVFISTLTSFAYAFLIAGEVRARNYIFKGEALPLNLIEQLLSWGYRVVTDPKPGDLIVYADDGNEPTHMGVLTANRRVISKLGPHSLVAITHDIPNVHPSLGTTILFFRQ